MSIIVLRYFRNRAVFFLYYFAGKIIRNKICTAASHPGIPDICGLGILSCNGSALPDGYAYLWERPADDEARTDRYSPQPFRPRRTALKALPLPSDTASVQSFPDLFPRRPHSRRPGPHTCSGIPDCIPLRHPLQVRPKPPAAEMQSRSLFGNF